MLRNSFLRCLTMLLAVLAFALPLTACCSGQPQVTLRNPFLVDAEPSSVAGPRLVQVPQYYAPSYSPPASYGASGCTPGATNLPPGYQYTPGR